MKILFINTIDNVGGAALVGWNLGQQLRGRGHDVKYIVGFKKSTDPEVYQLRKNLFTDYLTNRTGIDFNFMSRGLITKFLANDIDYGAKEEILNHPWYKEADIVHCNNLHGNFMKLETIIAIAREKKMVWTLHDEWTLMPSGAYADTVSKGGFYRRTCLNTYPAMLWDNDKYLQEKKKEIYKKADFDIVVISKWLKERVENSILSDKKIHLVYNGIDTDVFKRVDKNVIRGELGLPSDKKIIIFVADGGKNNPRKGWKYAEKVINHFSGNKNILFLSIGGQGNKNNFNIEKVKFVEYQNSNQLAKYYSAADLLLFPSMVETFGLIPLEAASAGTPAVAFPVGVIPEFIDHKKNGYIAKYGDLEDFIRGIEFIFSLADSELLNISLELTNKIKKNFSLDVMTDEYLKLYDKLLKK
jgi:glycosyltransferase involved in cell wall biosynthesis